MGTWLNSDGLYIRYNKDRINDKPQDGVYNFGGPTETIEVVIDLADLTTTDAVVSEGVRFPSGVLIESVSVTTDIAGADGSAIDIGLIRADRSTEHDYNGFVAAAATTTVNAVNKTTAGTGALVGTVLASTAKGAYMTASVASTLFTAGRIRVRVVVRNP